MTESEAKNQPAEEVDKPAENAVAETGAEEKVDEEPESGEEAKSEASQLQVRLDEAYGKNAELQNNYLRKAADLDNMRKRLARDREEIGANAITGLLEDLLPALDAFRLGLGATQGKEGAAEEVIKGFAMALEQMNEILLRRGLETIDPAGEPFDPVLHEALSQEPSDEVESGDVISVTRVGYRLNERLLRPAAVIVSKGSVETAAKDSDSQAD